MSLDNVDTALVEESSAVVVDDGNSQGVTEELSQEFSVEDASDEELDAYIEQYQKEREAAQNQDEEVVEEEDDESQTPAEIPQPEVPVQQQQSVTATVPTTTPEEAKRIVAQSAQNAQAELGEIARVREQLLTANNALAAKIEEASMDNPSAVFDLKIQQRTNADVLTRLNAREQAVRSRHHAVAAVATHAAEQFDLDAMAISLARDGATPDMLASFRRDPFQWADGPSLVQLAKRSHAEKLLVALIRNHDALKEENARLKSKSESIVKKIDSTVRKHPTMTARTGGGASGGGKSSGQAQYVDVSKLSDKELDEFIAKNGF